MSSFYGVGNYGSGDYGFSYTDLKASVVADFGASARFERNSSVDAYIVATFGVYADVDVVKADHFKPVEAHTSFNVGVFGPVEMYMVRQFRSNTDLVLDFSRAVPHFWHYQNVFADVGLSIQASGHIAKISPVSAPDISLVVGMSVEAYLGPFWVPPGSGVPGWDPKHPAEGIWADQHPGNTNWH